MGILSSLNTWIDEGAKEQERIRIARREEKKKKIDEFVHKEYTGKVFGTKPLMDLFGTHNLDEAFKDVGGDISKSKTSITYARIRRTVCGAQRTL